jgi:hypothetical protein
MFILYYVYTFITKHIYIHKHIPTHDIHTDIPIYLYQDSQSYIYYIHYNILSRLTKITF